MNLPFANQLLNIWDARPQRERLMLISVLAIVIFSAFEVLLYQPVRNQHTDTVNHFNKVMDDHHWLQAQAHIVQNAKTELRIGNLMAMSSEEKHNALEESISSGVNSEYEVEVFDEEDGKKVIEFNLTDVLGKTLLKWIADRVADGYLLHSLSIDILQQSRVKATIRFEL